MTEPTETTKPQPVPVPEPQPVPAPPAPAQLPAFATVWAVPQALSPAPRKHRPWLRTALRWSVATVVFLAVGGGTALAVMAPSRTDVPGLKTPADGRYTFPALSLPPLPPNALGPAEGASGSSGETVHAADLRKLLLPAPIGATVDGSYRGTDGWYPVGSFVSRFVDSQVLSAKLGENGLRHIAATAWTTPDGTRTEIYLLAFRSALTAYAVNSFISGGDCLPVDATGASGTQSNYPGLDSMVLGTLEQPAGKGRKDVRVLVLNENDVQAYIVMSNARSVPLVDSEQVAVLQHELLQG
jgi:hypothetical protein